MRNKVRPAIIVTDLVNALPRRLGARRGTRLVSAVTAGAVVIVTVFGPCAPDLAAAASLTEDVVSAEDFAPAESDGDEIVYEYDYDNDDGDGADTVDVTKEAPEVYESVEIDSKEDFLAFVENCHFDSWSVDKSVVLNVDLDFSGEEFEPIISFGGLFDGQDHTISGVSITGYADETGIFGTIQNTGVVANLRVEGEITPSGSQSTIGGIAGINYGTISNCMFTGRIEAQSEAGGIVGRNGQSGIVIACSTEGTLYASSGCGGIAGYNEGTISSCDNGADVNTDYQDSVRSLDELTEVIEVIEQNGSIFNTGELSSNSDNGGIAGFSSGVITSCTNRGRIGYEHVGYNVGGIVGRSSGFLYNNVNYGSVYGRKDVGGIAGQVQPYLTLSFTEETLEELQQEIDALQDAISNAMDGAGNYGSAVSNHLTNLSGLAQIAEDSVADIVSEGADIYDEAAGKINDATSTLQSVLYTFSSVGDSLDGYLGNVVDSFSNLGDYIENYFGGISDSVTSLLESLRAIFSFSSGWSLTGSIGSSLSSSLSELQSLLESLMSGEDAGSYQEWEYGGSGQFAAEETSEEYGEDGSEEDAEDTADETTDDADENGSDSAADGSSVGGAAEAASYGSSGSSSSGSVTGSGSGSQGNEAGFAGNGSSGQQSGSSSSGGYGAWNPAQDVSTSAGNADGQGSNETAAAEELAGFAQRAQAAAGQSSGSGSSETTSVSSGISQTGGSQDSAGSGSSADTQTQQDAADFAQELQSYQEQEDELQDLADQLQDYADAADGIYDGSSYADWEDDGEVSSLLGSILSGVRSLESSLERMRGILSSYDSSSSGSLKGLFGELSEALDTLGDSPDILSEIADAMDALASIDLQLNGVSDSLRTSGDNLYESVSQILTEFEALNQDLGDMMDSVGDDFSAVGDRIDDLMDTLLGSAEGIMNADFLDDDEDMILDVSDEDLEDGYLGRTTNCTNYGDVDADVNVGGIVGMVGVEYSLDPELDVETSGSTTLNYVFRARCIVDNSVNRGTISARTSAAGGIAGRMEMGLTAYCENYGSLASDGRYVGGIAGYSAGTVRDCVARCDLSGTTCLGGIVGYGTTLRRNLSMVNVLESEQYVGAVAGKVDNIDEIYIIDNYYYSESAYGIDGVSYEGIAEGVGYEELLAMDGITDGFDALTLTFMVEDEILEVITCSYRSSLSEDEIPSIPVKEGFYSAWSRTDFSSITANEVITADYQRIVTLLTSEETREGGLSVVEVDGSFRQEDVLAVRAAAAQGGELERWTVEIPEDVPEGTDGSAGAVHRIRYLVPDGVSDTGLVQIYLIAEDGTRTRVSTSGFSSYLTFEAEGNTVTFAAESVLSRNSLLPVLLGCAGAAAVVVLLAVLLRRRRRKRRLAAAGEAADADDWEDEDV